MCISYYVHVLHYVTEATQCNYDSLEYAFGLYLHGLQNLWNPLFRYFVSFTASFNVQCALAQFWTELHWICVGILIRTGLHAPVSTNMFFIIAISLSPPRSPSITPPPSPSCQPSAWWVALFYSHVVSVHAVITIVSFLVDSDEAMDKLGYHFCQECHRQQGVDPWLRYGYCNLAWVDPLHVNSTGVVSHSCSMRRLTQMEDGGGVIEGDRGGDSEIAIIKNMLVDTGACRPVRISIPTQIQCNSVQNWANAHCTLKEAVKETKYLKRGFHRFCKPCRYNPNAYSSES